MAFEQFHAIEVLLFSGCIIHSAIDVAGWTHDLQDMCLLENLKIMMFVVALEQSSCSILPLLRSPVEWPGQPEGLKVSTRPLKVSGDTVQAECGI